MCVIRESEPGGFDLAYLTSFRRYGIVLGTEQGPRQAEIDDHEGQSSFQEGLKPLRIPRHNLLRTLATDSPTGFSSFFLVL